MQYREEPEVDDQMGCNSILKLELKKQRRKPSPREPIQGAARDYANSENLDFWPRNP